MTSASTVLGLIPLAFATMEKVVTNVLLMGTAVVGWYGSLYSSHDVHRTGHLQLYFD